MNIILGSYFLDVHSGRRPMTKYALISIIETMRSAEQFDIDEVDHRILELLLHDCRLSYRRIARKAGVSVGTVLTRVRKLEQAELIKGYSALIEHEKLGYQLTAIAEITVSKGKLLEMEQAIGKYPNVCAVYDITGLTDALVIAKFRTREELSKFTKAILAMPFVDRTNTHVVLTTVKEDFRLL
jgi:DNA-binding Lrp family transcriptional regulator